MIRTNASDMVYSRSHSIQRPPLKRPRLSLPNISTPAEQIISLDNEPENSHQFQLLFHRPYHFRRQAVKTSLPHWRSPQHAFSPATHVICRNPHNGAWISAKLNSLQSRSEYLALLNRHVPVTNHWIDITAPAQLLYIKSHLRPISTDLSPQEIANNNFKHRLYRQTRFKSDELLEQIQQANAMDCRHSPDNFLAQLNNAIYIIHSAALRTSNRRKIGMSAQDAAVGVHHSKNASNQQHSHIINLGSRHIVKFYPPTQSEFLRQQSIAMNRLDRMVKAHQDAIERQAVYFQNYTQRAEDSSRINHHQAQQNRSSSSSLLELTPHDLDSFNQVSYVPYPPFDMIQMLRVVADQNPFDIRLDSTVFRMSIIQTKTLLRPPLVFISAHGITVPSCRGLNLIYATSPSKAAKQIVMLSHNPADPRLHDQVFKSKICHARHTIQQKKSPYADWVMAQPDSLLSSARRELTIGRVRRLQQRHAPPGFFYYDISSVPYHPSLKYRRHPFVVPNVLRNIISSLNSRRHSSINVPANSKTLALLRMQHPQPVSFPDHQHPKTRPQLFRSSSAMTQAAWLARLNTLSPSLYRIFRISRWENWSYSPTGREPVLVPHDEWNDQIAHYNELLAQLKSNKDQQSVLTKLFNRKSKITNKTINQELDHQFSFYPPSSVGSQQSSHSGVPLRLLLASSVPSSFNAFAFCSPDNPRAFLPPDQRQMQLTKAPPNQFSVSIASNSHDASVTFPYQPSNLESAQHECQSSVLSEDCYGVKSSDHISTSQDDVRHLYRSPAVVHPLSTADNPEMSSLTKHQSTTPSTTTTPPRTNSLVPSSGCVPEYEQKSSDGTDSNPEVITQSAPPQVVFQNQFGKLNPQVHSDEKAQFYDNDDYKEQKVTSPVKTTSNLQYQQLNHDMSEKQLKETKHHSIKQQSHAKKHNKKQHTITKAKVDDSKNQLANKKLVSDDELRSSDACLFLPTTILSNTRDDHPEADSSCLTALDQTNPQPSRQMSRSGPKGESSVADYEDNQLSPFDSADFASLEQKMTEPSPAQALPPVQPGDDQLPQAWPNTCESSDLSDDDTSDDAFGPYKQYGNNVITTDTSNDPFMLHTLDISSSRPLDSAPTKIQGQNQPTLSSSKLNDRMLHATKNPTKRFGKVQDPFVSTSSSVSVEPVIIAESHQSQDDTLSTTSFSGTGPKKTLFGITPQQSKDISADLEPDNAAQPLNSVPISTTPRPLSAAQEEPLSAVLPNRDSVVANRFGSVQVLPSTYHDGRLESSSQSSAKIAPVRPSGDFNALNVPSSPLNHSVAEAAIPQTQDNNSHPNETQPHPQKKSSSAKALKHGRKHHKKKAMLRSRGSLHHQ